MFCELTRLMQRLPSIRGFYSPAPFILQLFTTIDQIALFALLFLKSSSISMLIGIQWGLQNQVAWKTNLF